MKTWKSVLCVLGHCKEELRKFCELLSAWSDHTVKKSYSAPARNKLGNPQHILGLLCVLVVSFSWSWSNLSSFCFGFSFQAAMVILAEFKLLKLRRKRFTTLTPTVKLCSCIVQKKGRRWNRSVLKIMGVFPFLPQQPECHPVMTVESRRVTQTLMCWITSQRGIIGVLFSWKICMGHLSFQL